MDKLFDLHGLEVFSGNRIPIHGGSVELLVAKKGIHPVDPSVAQLRAEEAELGCDKVETYRRFADRVWEIKREVLGILRGYAAKGKKVYAFGAPAKGGTFLNSFHITPELVQCAVEVNPLKVGKYIPGVRIPIVDEAKTPPPDAYIVLAWNFLREFLQKQRNYIMNGGEFIVPIPKPVIINKQNLSEYAP